MADSNWNVGTFLRKLENALTSNGLDNTISSKPDIDEIANWSEWWTNDSETNYWNQSVKNLWENWKDLDNDNDDDSNKIKRVRTADAGWRFTGEPYVNPDLNIDNETYEKVRGDDKIESVLKNSKQMQYTHSQQQIEGSAGKQNQSKYTKDNEEYSKYIRLLMPKYLRRVEVEDLNRNFWVIAQAIGLISEYLLDPNSLLNKLLEGILKEIIQLWDNTHRIWEALYALGEKVNKSDERIDKITEAVQKTKVNIDLNYYPNYTEKGKEFRRMLGQNEDATDSITLENLYFLDNVDDQSSIITLFKDTKAVDVFNILEKRFGINKNSDDEEVIKKKINSYVNNLPSPHGYAKTFKKGCIISYTIGNQLYFVSYDSTHPYFVKNSKFFGVYRWVSKIENQVQISTNEEEEKKWSKKTSIISINNIIKDYYEKDNKDAIDKLNSSPLSNQSFGPITIERDGVNQKPLNKILSEITSFNFLLIDCYGEPNNSDNSDPTIKTVTTQDLVPSIKNFSALFQALVRELKSYKTTSEQSYQ